MGGSMYAGLGIVITVLLLLVDKVFCIDVCYETSLYYYYCEDGRECCNDNTQCCLITDSGLSTGAIVGIVIGSIAGFILLIALGVCLCGKGTQVGSEGRVVETRVQTISLQQEPPSYMASSTYGEGPSANPYGYHK